MLTVSVLSVHFKYFYNTKNLNLNKFEDINSEGYIGIALLLTFIDFFHNFNILSHHALVVHPFSVLIGQ